MGHIAEYIDKDDFLEKLFLEHYTEMEAFAANFFRNEDIAQDAVQETFLVAQKNINDLLDSPKPIGWLMETLKNVIGDTYRKRKRLMDVFVPLDSFEGQVFDNENIRIKYEGIISKGDLDLLIWIYCEDLSYDMAAKRLGITLDACKKRIQRAKLRLKEALEK